MICTEKEYQEVPSKGRIFGRTVLMDTYENILKFISTGYIPGTSFVVLVAPNSG
jgi:hypothetical protein